MKRDKLIILQCIIVKNAAYYTDEPKAETGLRDSLIDKHAGC